MCIRDRPMTSKLFLALFACCATALAAPSVADRLSQQSIGLATADCSLFAAQYAINASLLPSLQPPIPPIVGRQGIEDFCRVALRQHSILAVGGPAFRYNDTVAATILSGLWFNQDLHLNSTRQMAAISVSDPTTALFEEISLFDDIAHIDAPVAYANRITQAFSAYGHNCTRLGESMTEDATWAQPNRPTVVGREAIVAGCGYSRHPGWSTITQTFWNAAVPNTVVAAIGDFAPGDGTAADPPRHAPGVALFQIDAASGLIRLARIHGGL
eukprot:TRINITY_DN59982_c0_g1_i1.p1 TRINITY_DN59982_c0_g1~~TRINITY_DN59982_c0_g1_i1.p1  ORF type:complete len:271 (+),score=52.27 TRINITY_DN59982_c0_g1_i1:137-949(+)